MLRRLKGAAKMAARWELSSGKERVRMARDIKTMLKLQRKQVAVQRKIESLQQELDAVSERFASDLDDTDRLHKEHTMVIEAMNRQLLIYEQVERPYLTAANELELQRLKANIAVLAGKEALSMPQKEIEG